MSAPSNSQPVTSLEIASGPLPWELAAGKMLVRDEHGAVASFVGVVRNEHLGHAVSGINYQCHPPLAMTVLYDLAAQLRAEHGADLGVFIHHGSGWMLPGEVAVIIHIASGHRAAAFAACRQAIEQLKADLPVWKHEHYADGRTAWLPGS